MDSYKCTLCKKNFSYKKNLNRHLKSTHEKIQICHNYFSNAKFECSTCGKKFSRKDVLRKHLNIHENLNSYECDTCHAKFLKKSALIFHIKSCSKGINSNKDKHGQSAHINSMKTEHLNFDSFKNFEEWKVEEEAKLICRFSKYRVEKRRKGVVTTVFICSRSGTYKPKIKSERRQRRLKIKGSKKIGYMCSAEMKVIKKCNSSSVEVIYQSTHNHTVSTQKDLAYMSLNRFEREEIATKIEMGIPYTRIQEDISEKYKYSSNNEGMKRLYLTNNQDLRNIAASYHLAPETLAKDALNVETLLRNHSNWVKLYKKPGEDMADFPSLQNNDVLLIIMSPLQKSMLQKYGSDVVALDGTHGLNPYGYILHTLLVIDEHREGVASAFLITNRNDKVAIDVFLNVLKKEVGILRARVLMSDMQETYYNSWKAEMGSPEKRLFCTWHVREAWRRNLSKVPKEARENLKTKLTDLANETDQAEFRRKLDSFIGEETKENEKFLEYFKNNYYSNFDCWSYSSRMFAGINTNMHLESFHKNLKYWYGCRKKMKQLVAGLQVIFKYLIRLERNTEEKKIRGKLSAKLKIVRRRHDNMIKEVGSIETPTIMQLQHDNELLWLVSSFKKTTDDRVEMYTVRKLMLNCTNCPLVCEKCDECFHAYQCTCVDSSIKNNMCKHIHYLISAFAENIATSAVDSPSQIPQAVSIPQPRQVSQFDIILERKRLTETFIELVSSVQTAEEVKETEKFLKTLRNRMDAGRKLQSAVTQFGENELRCVDNERMIKKQVRLFDHPKKNKN